MLCWWCLQAQPLVHPQPSGSTQSSGAPASGFKPNRSDGYFHLLLILNTARKYMSDLLKIISKTSPIHIIVLHTHTHKKKAPSTEAHLATCCGSP